MSSDRVDGSAICMESAANSTLTYRSFIARKYGCWGGVAMDDLAQHDRRFHPKGYKKGDSCKLRESLKESDAPDADVKPTKKTTPEAEYEAVVAAYTNPDGSKKQGWLKAPNGKKTNLTERQWVQVRTPSFKRWFGDWENDHDSASKIVDENGEPMVVYHGTGDARFTAFRESEGGIFFTSIDRASWYASGEDKPRIKRYVRPFKSWDEVRRYASEKGIDFSEADHEEYEDGTYWLGDEIVSDLADATDVAQSLKEKVDDYGGMIPVFLNVRNPRLIDAKGKLAVNVNQIRNRKTQDGVIVENVLDPTFDEGSRFEDTNYIVYSPTQIKSAFDNTGEFSSGDPDIRH